MDQVLARLLATRVSADAGALRDLFIAEHRRAETLAWIFRVLLYLASVAPLVYLSHLYVRLRANARTLKARSEFEHLIAGISAPRSVERFVVVDPEQVAAEVVGVLRQDRSRTVAVPTPAGLTARVSNNLPIALRDFLFRASGGNRVTTGLDREARATYQQKMES